MAVHQWAREQIEACVAQAAEQQLDPLMALRALLSAVVERNANARGAFDLAAELEFIAANLDEQRDYSFMRP
jgi:triphosphoribosyl-dephospho-CoA synthetase